MSGARELIIVTECHLEYSPDGGKTWQRIINPLPPPPPPTAYDALVWYETLPDGTMVRVDEENT